MQQTEMSDTTRRMVAPGKGILAADESTDTIKKRFDAIGADSNEENRRSYRGALFAAPGIERFIGGVIMFDETIRQRSDDGTPFSELLAGRGVVPGIKVDKGTRALPGSPEETVTEGLDGLGERLEEYRGLGAGFAKWRAVIRIGRGLPTNNCVKANAHALARYAALCQEAGIVPIVEPEVLMEGDHSAGRCFDITRSVLRATFSELADAGVVFESMLLKPNMIVPGSEHPQSMRPDLVAQMTLQCLRQVVPAAVPGIVFLSGGQTELEATANLDAMNATDDHPWELSFSYGRALQQSALRVWAGKEANLGAARAAFFHRAEMNGLARRGVWTPELESGTSLA